MASTVDKLMPDTLAFPISIRRWLTLATKVAVDQTYFQFFGTRVSYCLNIHHMYCEYRGYRQGITFDPFSVISRSPAVLISDLSSLRASRSRCIFISRTDDILVDSIFTSTPRLAWLMILPLQSSLTSSSARCWQLFENRLYLGCDDVNLAAAGHVSTTKLAYRGGVHWDCHSLTHL